MRRVARRQLLSKQRATFVSRDGRRVGKAIVAAQLRAKPNSNVCIIRRVGGIGDVLMLTPTLRELKRKWPECHLTFAIDMHTTSGGVYEQLVRNAPFVDELIDARYVDRSKYDGVYDASAVCLRYERQGLPAINRIDLFARAAGLNRLPNKMPFYRVEVAEEQRVNCELGVLDPYVLLHVASNDDKRNWSPMNYLQLVRRWPEMNFLVADFNGKYKDWAEEPNVKDISSCTVRELAAYIQRSSLFFGPDSGPMHLAGALGTRSLVMFGSIPPQARINHYPSHKAITAGLHCSPCWYANCPYDQKCMKTITVDQVEQKLRSML